MSRSTNIYIAYNHADELLGGWTVKHELKTYAQDALDCHRDYRVAKVMRVPDGMGAGCGDYRATDITKDFLPIPAKSK